MSKSMNMLRTRRRDNNVKPNRKLDRKSSRGMIYENEELRLKTININAEVERGQSDIKKLKRENEMLKKEMWCLRDAYDKLDKMIKEKEISFSSSSTTCSTSETESCSTCSSDSNEVETNQNLENVQKTTTLKGLQIDFDHLSVVPEENSTENSDKNSARLDDWADEKNVIKPDQSYPSFETLTTPPPPPLTAPPPPPVVDDAAPRQQQQQQQRAPPKHFFSPIKLSRSCEGPLGVAAPPAPFRPHPPPYGGAVGPPPNLALMHPISKSSTDLIVKLDNRHFANTTTSSSFSNGGNLEELLNDIESISRDILKLSDPTLMTYDDEQRLPQPTVDFTPVDVPALSQPHDNYDANKNRSQMGKPYKSELNVVLMPTPMPLIGFEKYKNDPQDVVPEATSVDNFYQNVPPAPDGGDPFYFGPDYFGRYDPDNYINDGIADKNGFEPKPDVTERHVSAENDENTKINLAKSERDDERESPRKPDKKPEKQPKLSIRRKVSIHFKGKKTKNKSDEKVTTPKTEKRNIFDIKFDRMHSLQKTPSVDSKKSNIDEQKATPTTGDAKRNSEPKTPCSDCRGSDRKSSIDKQTKTRKSQSLSPEKHVHVKEDGKKQHKKHKKVDKLKNRRSTISNNEKFSNSAERFLRERSFSVCTDRSNVLGLGLGYNSAYSMYDEYLSERERTNSLSSCGTVKIRKMSNISNFPVTGKIPWCGCWGNGCL